jgi:hypothetical protein
MSYTPWSENVLLTDGSDQSIANMAAIGVDTVALNVWWFQDDRDSSVITPDFTLYSASTPSVIHAIEEIHDNGMKVMLKPMVDLRTFEWRGTINPSDEWFAGYADFINYWAEIAEDEGAELFSVGCEFKNTVDWSEHWRGVIDGVRGLYSGQITYAANHDSYQNVDWWDALDLIGIDAYFKLTNETDPTLGELEAAWAGHASNIVSWLTAEAYGLPVAFTEVGYRSMDGANTAPWAWWGDGEVDLQEQLDCYQALLNTCWGESWWRGAFWWNWETDPYAGGPTDMGFTPQGKPAEALLASYYAVPEPGTAALLLLGVPALVALRRRRR